MCLSVLSAGVGGWGVICFLGVIEGGRMEFLGQLQHDFPWKGGREWDLVLQCSQRELYCTTWEGAMAPEPPPSPLCPPRPAPSPGPNRSTPKWEKGFGALLQWEARLNWTLSLGGSTALP